MTNFKIAHETDNYTIKEIPLNYRIDIKRNLVLINPHTGIERDWYETIESPLQVAIDLAERVSIEYFRKMNDNDIKLKELKAKTSISRNLLRKIVV
jgi:hypothetical protein